VQRCGPSRGEAEDGLARRYDPSGDVAARDHAAAGMIPRPHLGHKLFLAVVVKVLLDLVNVVETHGAPSAAPAKKTGRFAGMKRYRRSVLIFHSINYDA
jgi:hypothetical protein